MIAPEVSAELIRQELRRLNALRKANTTTTQGDN